MWRLLGLLSFLLVSIPAVFADIECSKHITEAEHSGQSLKSINNYSFVNNPCLRKVNFSKNLLRTLPARLFVNVPDMDTLDLSDNQLPALPANVLVNSGVKKLNLAANNLTQANFSSRYDSVSILVLNFNPLHRLLSAELSALVNLDYLSAENCSIGEVDFSAPLPALTVLLLAKNRIRNLTRNSFLGADNLQYLDLSKNGIDKLPQKGLAGLKNLQYLWLSFNNLTKIESLFSEQQIGLKALHINNNGLELVSVNAFQPLKSLSVLNLRNNRLKTLNYRVFDLKARVGTLFLWGNPLHCACETRIHAKWVIAHVGLCIAECASPPDLEGISWTAMINHTKCN